MVGIPLLAGARRISQQLDRMPGPLVVPDAQSWLQQQARVALPLESHTASAGMANASPAPAPITRIATQAFQAMSKVPRTDADDTTGLEQALRNHLPIKDIGTNCPRF